MNDDPAATRLGPDSAEAVIGTIAPAIHALEDAFGCDVTVEVKHDRLWLLLPDFPLPPSWGEAQMPICLVADGAFPKLYLPRRHAVTQALARAQPGLLEPPEAQDRAAPGPLSPDGLWAEGWTGWGESAPRPTLGHGFATLIRHFADEMRQPLAAAPRHHPLTDMDRVRQALQPPPPPPPVPPITPDELFAELRKTVHSQEQALRSVSSVVTAHLCKPAHARPGVLLALGPTGVGKTRTAESIAPALNALRPQVEPAWKTVLINLSEYKEPHRVSQLLGAPAGYAGYGEKSQLVQALSASPRCVLVFDELEKAHPDLLEVLMNTLDTGVFTTPAAHPAAGAEGAAGRAGERDADPTHQLDCKESIFVFTSNIDQAGMLSEYRADRNPIELETALRQRLVAGGMKPELAIRLGRCVVFLPISEADRADIVLASVAETAREYGLEVKQVCPDLVVEVLRRAPTQTFGARAERHTVAWLLGDAFVQAVRDGLREVRVLSQPTRCEAWAPEPA